MKCTRVSRSTLTPKTLSVSAIAVYAALVLLYLLADILHIPQSIINQAPLWLVLAFLLGSLAGSAATQDDKQNAIFHPKRGKGSITPGTLCIALLATFVFLVLCALLAKAFGSAEQGIFWAAIGFPLGCLAVQPPCRTSASGRIFRL